MKYNIFDFATSELSHSAFFAWLIGQINPGSGGYSEEVREMGLEVVNEILKKYAFTSISSLDDIQRCVVRREEKHIDITAYLRLKDGRNIGVIIENKVGAQESRKNQLQDYYGIGNNLIDTYFEGKNTEKAFIYLKSDYDFEDPLIRLDKKGNIVPISFRKIDWKNIYLLFGGRSFKDSILKSYSWWIEKKYDSIHSKLDISRLLSKEEGQQLLQQDNIGHVCLFKHIFHKKFEGKQPCCAKKDDNGYSRFYYNPNLFFKLGSDKGNPWTQLWFPSIDKILFFYRLQIHTPNKNPKPLFHARIGYWGNRNLVNEKRKIRAIYTNLISKHNLKVISDDFPFSPHNNETSIGSFRLVGENINLLQKIEELHDDFFEQIMA